MIIGTGRESIIGGIAVLICEAIIMIWRRQSGNYLMIVAITPAAINWEKMRHV
jgi:hypothetical protein